MGRKRILDPKDVLAAIQRWIVEKGMPPTLEELRVRLRVGSTRTIYRYVNELVHDGLLQRWEGARGLRPLATQASGEETEPVAVLGLIPAGSPRAVEQQAESWVRLPKAFLQPRGLRHFLLRVAGDSMNRAAVTGGRINDGDLVLVQQRASADPGDVVAALVDGQVTVKRLSKGPDYFVLRPESSNPKHRPIVIRSEASVQGVVKRVFKRGSVLLASEEE